MCTCFCDLARRGLDHGCAATTDWPMSLDANCGSEDASPDDRLVSLVKDRDDEMSASVDGELWQSLTTDDGSNRSFTSMTNVDAVTVDVAVCDSTLHSCPSAVYVLSVTGLAAVFSPLHNATGLASSAMTVYRHITLN